MVILLFGIAIYGGETEADSRTLTFATLVIGDLMLILTNRSRSRPILTTMYAPNRAHWWIIGVALSTLVLITFVPFLQALFRFAPLHLFDTLICLGGGVASLIWFECWKLLRNRRKHGSPGEDDPQ